MNMILSRCRLRWPGQTFRISPKHKSSFSTHTFSFFTQPRISTTSSPISGTSSTRPRIYKSNLSLLDSSTRYVSTASASPQISTPTPTPTATATVPLDAQTAAQIANDTSIDETMQLSAQALLHAPEQIGYLKSMGLDWGWGPTSVMEYIMEHVHIYTGGPWWLTITMTAVLIRAALFKPYIVSAENAAKLAVVSPITKPLMQKMMAAQKAGDTAALFQVRHEQSMIYKRAGIKTWKSGIPLIQMVLGFGTFRLINGMAKLPVPGLETGGTLWFTNLALPDPLYILPAATAVTLHWVMRKGGETGVQMMSPKMLAAMKWGFPCISMVFTSWLPSGVQLTFFVSGLLSLTQTNLLRKPSFRNYFGMTPFPTATSGPPKTVSPYQGNIRIDEGRVLSLAELSRRFESPDPSRSRVTPASVSEEETMPETSKKGKMNQIFTGAIKDIKGTVQEVVRAGRGLAGETNKEVQSRLDKAEIRQRELYEKKKQDEAWMARLEEQKLRKKERAKRKALKNAH